MIVKVQLSLCPNGEKVLIYNKSRSVFYETAAPQILKDGLAESHKGYFEATLDKKGVLHLGRQVKDRNW